MIRRMPAVLALCLASRLAAGGDRFPAKGGDIEITPLVHASVQVQYAGKVIQVDPWSFGDLSLARPADLILISDDVGHHLDAKAIQRLRKPGAPVIMPASGKAQVPDGIVLGNGESTTAASIRGSRSRPTTSSRARPSIRRARRTGRGPWATSGSISPGSRSASPK